MKRLFASILVLLSLTSAALLFAYSRRQSPVLFNFVPEPDAVERVNYPLLNPFRDKAIEKATEPYLRELRTGDASRIVLLVPEESREHVKQREKEFPIRRTRIASIDANSTAPAIGYWVKRGGGYCQGIERCETQVAFVFGYDANGNLVLRRYRAIY